MTRPTLDGLARDLAEGRTTAAELVRTALAQISDPAGEGARTFLTVDEEGARATAGYIDALRRRGHPPALFDDTTHQQDSTVNRHARILVNVHPGAPVRVGWSRNPSLTPQPRMNNLHSFDN